MYRSRLWRSWRAAGRFSRSLAISTDTSTRLPFPTLASIMLAILRFLKKLSMTLTTGSNGGSESITMVLERVIKSHHCQLLYASVGKAFNAGCRGSHRSEERCVGNACDTV